MDVNQFEILINSTILKEKEIDKQKKGEQQNSDLYKCNLLLKKMFRRLKFEIWELVHLITMHQYLYFSFLEQSSLSSNVLFY